MTLPSDSTSTTKPASTHPVYEPYNYLLNNTEGKNIRSKMIDAFNLWLKVDKDDIEIVKNVVSKLHNASLLIDDIEDNSRLRRGIPCAHLIYGVASTINSANYMYFEALKDCLAFKAESSQRQASKVFIEELENLHRGQALDIHWRDNNICPTEQEYMDMVRDKTGGLFRLSIGLMQACSKETIDLTPIVNNLADLFQILDDYLNLQATKYHVNKSYCEDLTEGKFSFPIIHAINSDPNDNRLINILKQKTEDVELKKYAVEVMKSKSSFEFTKQVLLEKRDTLVTLIKQSGGNPYVEKIIESLMSQLEQENLESSESVDFTKV